MNTRKGSVVAGVLSLGVSLGSLVAAPLIAEAGFRTISTAAFTAAIATFGGMAVAIS